MTLLRLLSMLQSTGAVLSVTTTAGGGTLFLDRLGEEQVRRYHWQGDEPTDAVVTQVFADLERDMSSSPTARDPLLERLIQ